MMRGKLGVKNWFENLQRFHIQFVHHSSLAVSFSWLPLGTKKPLSGRLFHV